MNVTDNLVTIVSLAVAFLSILLAVLSIVITLCVFRRDKTSKEHEKTIMRKQQIVNNLANQVKAYYILQNLLIDDIAAKTSESPKTLKEKYHKLAKANNNQINISGWMSSSEADKYIRSL